MASRSPGHGRAAAAQRPQHHSRCGRLHDDQQPLRLRPGRSTTVSSASHGGGAWRVRRAAPQGAGRAGPFRGAYASSAIVVARDGGVLRRRPPPRRPEHRCRLGEVEAIVAHAAAPAQAALPRKTFVLDSANESAPTRRRLPARWCEADAMNNATQITEPSVPRSAAVRREGGARYDRARALFGRPRARLLASRAEVSPPPWPHTSRDFAMSAHHAPPRLRGRDPPQGHFHKWMGGGGGDSWRPFSHPRFHAVLHHRAGSMAKI